MSLPISRLSRRVALFVLLTAAASLQPSPADARRPATRAESRALWRIIDAAGRCTQRRGVIATVKNKRHAYGKVTIADSTCGNGEFVLRRRRGTTRWVIAGAGSDWGNPDRCASDRRKIPISVLRDLFGAKYCAPT